MTREERKRRLQATHEIFPEVKWQFAVSLIPNLTSARTHNRKQRNKVLSLLKQHGPLANVIVDPNGHVIDGHLLLECLLELGYTAVPTVVVRTNDPRVLRALSLRLNRLPQDAGWDRERLRDTLQFLCDEGYELDQTAFDPAEVDALLEFETPSTGLVEDGDSLVAPSGPAISVLGDIIACGSHRLACGDMRDGALLLRLLADAPIRMVLTDPPYGLPIDGFVSGLGKIKHREFLVGAGEMSLAELRRLFVDLLGGAQFHLVDGGLFYVFMDWRHIHELVGAGLFAGLKLVNIAVWAKTTPAMGSFYRSQHELCAIFKRGDAPHVNNVQLGKYGRSRSNLWTARGMAGFGPGRDELLATHPTVKPVRLLADAILDASGRGEAVLDPFLGSGSTLIACEETSRVCYGVELDPLYVDAAIRRWQKTTRRDAVFIDTGEPFDARAERAARPARALGWRNTSGGSDGQ